MEKEFVAGRFQAMGCPCEILLDTGDVGLLHRQLTLAQEEAQRIEQKFSRYQKGSIVYQINHNQGEPLEVDEETSALLNFAADCYGMSEGLFDITRQDWSRVKWESPRLQLPVGFDIDLGGICKEYAADRIADLLVQHHPISTLVNLGGDIAARGSRLWSVGIEDVLQAGRIARTLHLNQGGVATSGTTKRPGHLLNPRTGTPVLNAPASVTVAATTCTEAGFWSTLAVLQGAQAESFLQEQSLEAWCYRPAA